MANNSLPENDSKPGNNAYIEYRDDVMADIEHPRECPSIQFFRDLLSSRHDSLAPYRDRILLSIGAMIELLLTPFTILNFLKEEELVAGLLLLIQIALLADLLAAWQRRKPPVPPVLLLIPFVAGMSAAIVVHGSPAVLWSYPVVVYCYFVLKRRTAILCSLAVLLHTCAMTFWFIGPEMAWRLGATLLLAVIMINVVLNVIFDLHQHLARQALTDPLTGCFNRRFLRECLEAAVARFCRHGAPVSLLMIDVDHFKQVNDRFGHGVGDTVLQNLTYRIRERMRIEDRLFRYGGEEFVLLLEDTPEMGATMLAEAIRGSIASTPPLADYPITVSIGVCAYRPGQAIDDWLNCADRGLYLAKSKGRNRVCCQPETHAQACA